MRATVRSTFVPGRYPWRTQAARQSGSGCEPPIETHGTIPVPAGTVPATGRAAEFSISPRPAGPGPRRSTTSPYESTAAVSPPSPTTAVPRNGAGFPGRPAGVRGSTPDPPEIAGTATPTAATITTAPRVNLTSAMQPAL